jgi:hypothetical protein
MECGKLGPAFAAGTISEEESGGKPPHSKNSGLRLRKDRVCPESFGNLTPTQNVSQPAFSLFPLSSPVQEFFILATYYVVNVHLRQSLSAVGQAKEDAGNSGFGCGWARWEVRGSIPLVASKVRGMIVKGMGKSVFRFIPLTIIPLTALRPFPTIQRRPLDGMRWNCREKAQKAQQGETATNEI